MKHDLRRALWLEQIHCDPRMGSSEFHAAYVLSRFLNRTTGDAFPGQVRMAAELQTTERNVRRLVASLVAAGHLKILLDGRRNRYRPILQAEGNSGQNRPVSKGASDHSEEPKSGQICPVSEQDGMRTNPSADLPDTGRNCPVNADESVRLTLVSEPLEKAEPSENLTVVVPEIVSRGYQEGPLDPFEEFWSVYPRREGKREAKAAFHRALKRATVDQIIAGAERLASLRRDPYFAPMPAKWLHSERWSDEPVDRPLTPHEAMMSGLAMAAEDWARGTSGDD